MTDSSMSGGPDDRLPRSVYARGGEPDPRFSMANERTALAWVRTAVALVAGGIGLTSLVKLADLTAAIDVAAVGLCLSGGGVAAAAVLGWRRRELALRTGRPLPAPVALPWVAAGLVVLAFFLATSVLVAPR